MWVLLQGLPLSVPRNKLASALFANFLRAVHGASFALKAIGWARARPRCWNRPAARAYREPMSSKEGVPIMYKVGTLLRLF